MILLLVWMAFFFWTTLRAGYLATDSRFLPLFPPTAMLAALGLVTLMRWNRTAGLAAALVVVLGVGFWTATLESRFTGVMPQQASSEWAKKNIPPGSTVYLQSKGVYWNPDFPLREHLQAKNADSYARETDWTLFEGKYYDEGRPSSPDFVFVTAWLPRSPIGQEWFHDPDYELVATFPGKVHLFGKRFPVWIDFYDVDTWAFRRKG